MSNRNYYLYLISILLLLLRNPPTQAQVIIPSVDNSTLYSYEWYLFLLPGTSLYGVDNSRVPYILFSPEDIAGFSGSAVCNDIEGKVEVAGKNSMRFTRITEEAYNCENELDRLFIDMLHQVRYYKIRNHQLKLFGHDGTLLSKFYADISQMSYYPLRGLDGTWYPSLLKKPKDWMNLDLVDSLPIITFYKDNPGLITGFTGCNSFSSHYTIEGNKIKFTDIPSFQLMECNAELEKNFLTNLSETTMFWVSADLLSFWKGNSLVIQFERANDLKLSTGPAKRFIDKKMKRTKYTCTFD